MVLSKNINLYGILGDTFYKTANYFLNNLKKKTKGKREFLHKLVF